MKSNFVPVKNYPCNRENFLAESFAMGKMYRGDYLFS